MANGSLSAANAGQRPTRTHPVLQWKDPVRSPPGTEVAVEAARCHMTHTLKQDRGAQVECEAGRHSHTGDKASTGSEDSLCLGTDVSQAQGPYFPNLLVQ